jgi:hypothetical protein
MLEIIKICGYSGEGKTTKMIQEHVRDDAIFISNEMTAYGSMSMIARVLEENTFLTTVEEMRLEDNILEVIERVDRSYDNHSKRTLLLDGINLGKAVSMILTAIPKRFDKIVYTQTIARNTINE